MSAARACEEAAIREPRRSARPWRRPRELRIDVIDATPVEPPFINAELARAAVMGELRRAVDLYGRTCGGPARLPEATQAGEEVEKLAALSVRVVVRAVER